MATQYVVGAVARINKDCASYHTKEGQWAVVASLEHDPQDSATIWIMAEEDQARRAAAAILGWPRPLNREERSALEGLVLRTLKLRFSQRRALTSLWTKLCESIAQDHQEGGDEGDEGDDGDEEFERLVGTSVEVKGVPILPSPHHIFQGLYSGSAHVDSVDGTTARLSFSHGDTTAHISVSRAELIKMVDKTEQREAPRPFRLLAPPIPPISPTLVRLLKQLPLSGAYLASDEFDHFELAVFAHAFGIDGFGAECVSNDPGDARARLYSLVHPFTIIGTRLPASWNIPNGEFLSYPKEPAALARKIIGSLPGGSNAEAINLEPQPPAARLDRHPLAVGFLSMASSLTESSKFLDGSTKLTIKDSAEQEFARGPDGLQVRMAALDEALKSTEDLSDPTIFARIIAEEGPKNAAALNMLLFTNLRHAGKKKASDDTSEERSSMLPSNITVTQNNGDLGEKGDQIVSDIKTLGGGDGLAFLSKIAAIARDDDRAKESLQKTLAHASITAPISAAALDRIINSEQDLSKCFAAAGTHTHRSQTNHALIAPPRAATPDAWPTRHTLTRRPTRRALEHPRVSPTDRDGP